MIRRRRHSKIPVQGNVYPVPTLMYMQDDMTRFSIMSGQPLGGWSPQTGVLDLFLDRQPLQDDNRGMGQGVTDNRKTRLSFKLLMEKRSDDELKPSLTVQHELHCLLHPILLFESKELTPHMETTQSLIQKSLPCDLQIINFRTCLFSGKHHLTLHRTGISCDSSCNSDGIFNPKQTFTAATSRHLISSFKQMKLSHQEVIRENIALDEDTKIPEMGLATYEFSRDQP